LWARLIHGIIRCYCRRFHRLDSDRSRLPDAGPAILVANHHAGPDPLFLIATNRRLLSFLIAQEYFDVPQLRWLYRAVGCVPVSRGRPTVGTVRGAQDLLEDGRVVGIFPEGGIHSPESRVRPKLGVALLAMESGAPVIPARLSGLRQLPGSDLRTFLRPRRVRLRYGPPVPLEDLRQRYGGESDREVLTAAAQRIQEAIYALPG